MGPYKAVNKFNCRRKISNSTLPSYQGPACCFVRLHTRLETILIVKSSNVPDVTKVNINL